MAADDSPEWQRGINYLADGIKYLDTRITSLETALSEQNHILKELLCLIKEEFSDEEIESPAKKVKVD